MDESRNIIIVGGGVTGTSCLYFLVNHPNFNRERDTITLFESSGIASAASGKASGFLSLEWHGPSTSSLAALSYNLHRQLANEHDGHRKWGYRALDTWSIKADENCTHPDKLSPEIEWIEPSIVEKVTRLGNKKNSAQVHPYKFCHSIFEEASKVANVNLVKGHVISVDENEVEYRLIGDDYAPDEDEEITSVEELHTIHSMEASHVIVAAGPWTPHLIPNLRICGARIHSITVDLPMRLNGNAVFSEIAYADGTVGAPEFYAREDELYVCGEFDDEPLPELSSETRVDQGRCQAIKECADHFHPVIRDSNVKVRQACYLPISNATGAPVIGKIGSSIYVAAAHGCWGITLGPGTGKVLSEMVLDGKVTSANIDLLDPEGSFV
ncbi:FAD-dependent oxidoreductase involved in late endosome to Golgi transport [Schizosaccharomyces osmophilus]|uniref:FAD-dependent oxidoreductase involved in late endosome to Golgi transport n=1 Tax=Schizosaccharomyces osmophilus TaxID=2545709 RepID=A0AAE9WE50_9SCHI|nr:FAD-dependent oxidoreductase involved in late endosome to Golgi transport [Schizosaccharomyces osmophilus]WBW74218.1 FAD-dependent oxidoreductase involved in late endosome to Golgi transport [Schizosaccharomyces osmophilus]